MKTILIVDDEAASRYALRRALEHGYRIAEADSAAAAREALVRERADLVLLDIVMSGEDGMSFLRWMRDAGHTQPVIVVSALDTARTAVEALKLGSADYLAKGFDVEELRKLVEDGLSQESAHSCDPAIVFQGRLLVRFLIGHHRTQLATGEKASSPTDPLLQEENGHPGIQDDQQGQERQ